MESTKSESRQALEAFAWQICAVANCASASIDPAERIPLEQAIRDRILLEDERGLRFADELTMVGAAAKHVLDTESERLLSTPKACFERLDEIWATEIGRNEAVSGHVLASLHNASHLDAFEWGRLAIGAGVRVFDVLHIMERAVPLFQHARAETVLEFFAGNYERVKNDAAGGFLYTKLPQWFAQYPDVARDLKQLHELKPHESSAGLYGCALHGLLIHAFAYGFALTLEAAHSSEFTVGGPALHILGLVDYNNSACLDAVDRVVQLCTHILRAAGHPLLGTAVATLGRLVTLNEPAIVELLSDAGRSEVPEAQYALSELLWREQESLRDRDWFWPLFLHLAVAKAEHGSILRNIDMLLMGWVSDPARQLLVLDFLHAWIGKRPRQTPGETGLDTHFPSTFHRLAEQPTLLNKALTCWLLDDGRRYPLIARHAISRLRTKGITALTLDPALIDALEPNEIRFLLRRILGYVIGDEAQIRLVFSLVRTRDAKERTFPLVTAVLRDQVGYDFPQQTIEFLRARQSDPAEAENSKALCTDIATVLQVQLDALDALPRLKEFRPSSSKVRRFAKERHKQMYKAFDEASKNSIWRQLGSNSILKAGRRTFQNINGQYTEPMELKGMSHAMALPRSEISDPVGAARERFLYRAAKRDAP